MTLPVRSIRLEKRTSRSLDTLSGSSGEIFFDADENTLRVYTANQSSNIVMADRAWVQGNTFSGDFNDLTNKPSIPTDINQLSDTTNQLFSGDYFDLTNAPDLDTLTVDISTIDSIGDVDTSTTTPVAGQLLEYDGTNWVNTTVAGFTDTNTTYAVSAGSTASGAEIVLTDDDAVSQAVELVGSTGISLAITDTNQITLTNSATYALTDLSNVSAATPAEGNTLVYSSGSWISSAPSGGVALDDISVTTDTASGGGSLSYNAGTFTFAPADLSSVPSLSSFSVTTDAAQSGGTLSYDDTSGTFTFRPANLSGFVELTDFSIVTDGTPSGGGSLSYNNSTGVFTFVPAASTGGASDLVDDTTPQLGGDLDLNSSDITGTGDINITGAGTFTGVVAADSFSSSATGAPSIVSASTIELDAPDGIILGTPSAGNIVLETILDGADTGSTKTGEWKVKLSGPYGNISGEIFEIGQTTEFGNTLTFDISTNLNTHGAVINYTDDLIIKAPSITFDTALIGENLKAATDSGTVITIDASSTSTVYDFSISGNRTLAFTNVPTTQDRIYTFRLIVSGTVTITGATVNGTSRNPIWKGGDNATSGTSEITIRILFPGGSNPTVMGNIREYS